MYDKKLKDLYIQTHKRTWNVYSLFAAAFDEQINFNN